MDSNGDASPWASRKFKTYDPEPPGTPGGWEVESGYKLEVFTGGFQLPVNIAFVPNPGPGAKDPYFYVSELFGNVKLVTRDGTVSTYAHGLLNFDPLSGPFSSGEAGLAGIVVDPPTGDLFVTLVYEAPAPPGAEVPVYGRVLRLKSTDGGRTMSSMQTVFNAELALDGRDVPPDLGHLHRPGRQALRPRGRGTCGRGPAKPRVLTWGRSCA